MLKSSVLFPLSSQRAISIKLSNITVFLQELSADINLTVKGKAHLWPADPQMT